MGAVLFSLIKQNAIQRLYACAQLGFSSDILHHPAINAPDIASAERMLAQWPVDQAADLLRLFPSLMPVNWQAQPLNIHPAGVDDWELSLQAA